MISFDGQKYTKRNEYMKEIQIQDNKLYVIIEPESGKDTSSIDIEKLIAMDVVIVRNMKSTLKVLAPINKLWEIPDKVKGIYMIRLPSMPIPMED